MKKTMLFSLLLALGGLSAAAEGPSALEALGGLDAVCAEVPAPGPAAELKAAGRKFYVSESVYRYRADAQTKAADYAASVTAAGIETLGTTILTREDGDDTLYYFSIEYAGGLTLRHEQQAGIPDKLRADIIHDDLRDGLRRAGVSVVRSGVRKEDGYFAAYCLYAQEDADGRAVRTYASLARQSGAGLDATPLFHENMGPAIADLEGAGRPVVFRLRAPTGWMVKFFSASKPKRLQSGVQTSYTAALADMRSAVARLKGEGKVILDANTALVGSYWTIDFVEK
jgi:hypothetical protein